jgi:hypothetical protein
MGHHFVGGTLNRVIPGPTPTPPLLKSHEDQARGRIPDTNADVQLTLTGGAWEGREYVHAPSATVRRVRASSSSHFSSRAQDTGAWGVRWHAEQKECPHAHSRDRCRRREAHGMRGWGRGWGTYT